MKYFTPEVLVFVFVIAALFFSKVNARKYFFRYEYFFTLRCFIFGVFFCIVTKFFLFSVDFGNPYK